MKAYLVKDETTLQRLAQQKFDEELAKDPNFMALSRGKISSIDAYSTSFGSINSERALQLHSERASRESSIERERGRF